MNVDYDSIIHVLGLSNDCDKIHAYTLIQKLNLRVYVFVCVFVCMYVCTFFPHHLFSLYLYSVIHSLIPVSQNDSNANKVIL